MTYRMQSSQADEKGMTIVAYHVPTAGSHTYKVVSTQSGAGNKLVAAGADMPAFIAVELA